MTCEVANGSADAALPVRTLGPARSGRAVLALAMALVVIAAACFSCSPGPTSPPLETEVPIGATPWPNGTVGQYGLRIDPSLLAQLPGDVGAYPLAEDAETEMEALDDADLAKTFDSYAAASIGEISDDNWLRVVIGHLKPASQTADFYTAWVEQYASGACSQADGVSTSGQQTINDWIVDTATCAGGPVVYTLALGNGTILSMFGFGAKDLGRVLIDALYS